MNHAMIRTSRQFEREGKSPTVTMACEGCGKTWEYKVACITGETDGEGRFVAWCGPCARVRAAGGTNVDKGIGTETARKSEGRTLKLIPVAGQSMATPVVERPITPAPKPAKSTRKTRTVTTIANPVTHEVASIETATPTKTGGTKRTRKVAEPTPITVAAPIPTPKPAVTGAEAKAARIARQKAEAAEKKATPKRGASAGNVRTIERPNGKSFQVPDAGDMFGFPIGPYVKTYRFAEFGPSNDDVAAVAVSDTWGRMIYAIVKQPVNRAEGGDKWTDVDETAFRAKVAGPATWGGPRNSSACTVVFDPGTPGASEQRDGSGWAKFERDCAAMAAKK
jgi:hypothetical protein